MIPIAAVALLVGILATLAWIGMSVAASSVDGWEHLDPDRRFGAWGRRICAALVGVGMGGLSASFAGWPVAAVALAAVGGGVAAALLVDWLTPAPS